MVRNLHWHLLPLVMLCCAEAFAAAVSPDGRHLVWSG